MLYDIDMHLTFDLYVGVKNFSTSNNFIGHSEPRNSQTATADDIRGPETAVFSFIGSSATRIFNNIRARLPYP